MSISRAILGVALLPTLALAEPTLAVRVTPMLVGHSEAAGFTVLGISGGLYDTSGWGGELSVRGNLNGMGDPQSGYELAAVAVRELGGDSASRGFGLSFPVRAGLAVYDGFTPEVFEHVSWPMKQASLVADGGLDLHWWGDAAGFTIRGLAGVAQPVWSAGVDAFEAEDGGRPLDETRFRWAIDVGLVFRL